MGRGRQANGPGLVLSSSAEGENRTPVATMPGYPGRWPGIVKVEAHTAPEFRRKTGQMGHRAAHTSCRVGRA